MRTNSPARPHGADQPQEPGLLRMSSQTVLPPAPMPARAAMASALAGGRPQWAVRIFRSTSEVLPVTRLPRSVHLGVEAPPMTARSLPWPPVTEARLFDTFDPDFGAAVIIQDHAQASGGLAALWLPNRSVARAQEPRRHF